MIGLLLPYGITLGTTLAVAASPLPPVAPPVIAPAPDWHTTRPASAVLVHWLPLPDLQRVTLVIHAGHPNTRGPDPDALQVWQEQWGQASTLADRVETHRAARRIDLHTAASAEGGAVRWMADFPSEAWPEAIEALAQLLHQPHFAPRQTRDAARHTWRYLSRQEHVSPLAAAGDAIHHLWYPDSHPRGHRPDPRRLRRLGPSDLEEVHRQAWALRPVQVVIAGPVDPQRDADALHALWQDRSIEHAPRPVWPPAPPRGGILGVHVEEAPLAAVAVRLPAPSISDEDRLALDVAQWALGDHFLSRINANLRERRGWTYGIETQAHTDHEHGHWTVFAEVPVHRAHDAIEEIEREIRAFLREGPTQEELLAHRHQVIASWNHQHQSARVAAASWTRWLQLGFTPEEARDRSHELDRLTPDEVRDRAERWLDPRLGRVVIAGDRDALRAVLDPLDIHLPWYGSIDAALGRLEDATP